MDWSILRGFHRRLVRLQLRAQSRPQRSALAAGALAGVMFGAVTGLLVASGQMPPRGGEPVPAWLAWAAGAGGGVFFGGWMALWFWWFARRFNPDPLPAGTDPDALIAARRCLRRGRRSDDPDVDRLVVHLVEQMSAAKRWSDPRWLGWFCGVVFTLGLGTNIAAVVLAPGGVRWINIVGIVVFAGFLCVVPYTVRSARRVRALARSIGESENTGQ